MARLGKQIRFSLVMAVGAAVAWLAFDAAALAIERAHTPTRVLAGLRDPISIVLAVDRRPVGQVHKISAKERIAAQQVLRRAPIFPAALWLLQRQEPDGIESDRSLLLLADRMTRRDLPTEFSLIQSYAAAGDAVKLLDHVDHAASTVEVGGGQLIEQVALGLDSSELSDALITYGGRPWMDKVLVSAFAKGPAPQSVADFLTKAKFAPERVFRARLPNLLARLVNAGDIQKASQLARTLGWQGSLGISGFAISKKSTDPNFSPLNWTLGTAPGFNPAIDREGNLAFEVQPSQTGVVIQRFTAIDPGKYNIRAIVNNIGGGNVKISVEMRCIFSISNDNFKRNYINLDGINSIYVMSFEISGHCPVQRWLVSASGIDIQFSNPVSMVVLNLRK